MFSFFMQVGAVGDHGAHAQGQGEEHLAASGSQDGEEVRCFLNDTVLQSPAGNEHILQAVHSAGQGAGADDADEQDDEQSGHTHGADLLDTAADAAHDDDHGQQDEDQAVDHGLHLVAHEGAEHTGTVQAVGAEAGTEQVAHIQHHILDAVAAQGAVEEQDQEGRQNAQPAQPLELLGQDLIRAHGAAACLTAQSQLAHHDDDAAAGRQDQINNEEGKSAVCTHFIGETPDVTQADCRTNGGHQKSKIGSKAFSFFHSFLSFKVVCPLSKEVYLHLIISVSSCK